MHCRANIKLAAELMKKYGQVFHTCPGLSATPYLTPFPKRAENTDLVTRSNTLLTANYLQAVRLSLIKSLANLMVIHWFTGPQRQAFQIQKC